MAEWPTSVFRSISTARTNDMNIALKVLLVLLILTLQEPLAYSQRYVDVLFPEVQVDRNITYGENFTVMTGIPPSLEDLKMDVYSPVGDTAQDRFLILMAHSGSWFPKGVNTLPYGEKSDSSMIALCTEFAKRGWVAASIDYRLGWNPTPDILGGNQELRARSIIQAVYRTMQDMKTAIRYFRKDEAGPNTYRIDPTKIVAAGTGSGAYAVVACASLNKVSELNLFKLLSTNGKPYVSIDTLGDFEGFGGDPNWNKANHEGYSSDFRLVSNLEGAVGDSSWIEPGEPPMVNMSGVDNALIPYKTKVGVIVTTGDPIISVSGAYVIAQEGTKHGNTTVWDTVNWADPYTARAKSLESFEGLFPFLGEENAYEAWAWYDPNDPYTVDSVELSPGNWVQGTGYGTSSNPFASREKAYRYIDTIMNYFTPRALKVLGSEPVGVEPQHHSGGFRVYEKNGNSWVVSEDQEDLEIYRLYDITGGLLKEGIVNDLGFELPTLEGNCLYILGVKKGGIWQSRKYFKQLVEK